MEKGGLLVLKSFIEIQLFLKSWCHYYFVRVAGGWWDRGDSAGVLHGKQTCIAMGMRAEHEASMPIQEGWVGGWVWICWVFFFFACLK